MTSLNTIFLIGILGSLAYVFYDSNLPSKVLSPEDIAHDGGLLFKLKDGRMLEYFDSKTLGPTVVLIHGGFQTGHIFQQYGLEEKYRIISPSLPGFGGSQSNNKRSFLSFGEDVRQLLDHLQVTSFLLGGGSYGGVHSAAIAAVIPERVLGWFVIAPVVPALPDFKGYSALIKIPHLYVIVHYLQAIPYLNRFIVKHLYKRIFSRPYSDSVWAELAGKDPLGSFQAQTQEFKEKVYSDFYRSVKYNLDGFPDISETEVQAIPHIDYLGLGKQMGTKPIHIHYGRNDTLVDPACPTYMFDRLREGGATNVLLLPSESVEGHYYTFTQVSAAIEQLVQELSLIRHLDSKTHDATSVDDLLQDIPSGNSQQDSLGSIIHQAEEEMWHPEL